MSISVNGKIDRRVLPDIRFSTGGELYTLVCFCMPNRSALRFCRLSLADLRELVQICANVASAMVDYVTGNLTHLLMNRQLLSYVDEMGVAAMVLTSLVCAVMLRTQYFSREDRE